MFAVKRPQAGNSHDEHDALPLAPMADVFMVVLIFLLKSFSYDLTSVAANTDITLPGAKAQGQMETTLRIDLSEGELRFNDQLVTHLSHYHFEEKDLDSNGLVLPLQRALQSVTGEEKGKTAKVMLYADQHAPYTAVKSCLKTAVSLGLSKLQIAVAQE